MQITVETYEKDNTEYNSGSGIARMENHYKAKGID